MSKDEAPGVSIIRPLRGVDCNMYENLASSFRQDYPRFEIIFSVAQPHDPAVAVVRDLMKKFPEVDARLIIGDKDVGINPKINNMIQSYETAKYDIVWVLDSNVYVDSGCMGRSVDKMMKPGVGLVHHLPFGARPQTLGSELELMFLDTVHAKMYLFINWTGLASCVVGKSNLYRRSDLDKVGGMAAFGKFMAEDNLVATAIFNMGYKHEMTGDLAYQSLGSMTPSDFFLRRARWTRIRKYTVTAATIVEPFIEMIGCGLVASYAFNLLWNIHALNFLAFHFVMWFLIDLSLFQALSGEKVDNLRGFLMAWCLRELTALPLFAYAVAGSTVDWRDQSFYLLRDGTVKPV
ncbi:MAG: glycosyltransferase family 21 protein, partial [Benniella sp.]